MIRYISLHIDPIVFGTEALGGYNLSARAEFP